MKTTIKLILSITVAASIFFPCAHFMNRIEDDQPPVLAIKIQLLVDSAKASLGLCR